MVDRCTCQPGRDHDGSEFGPCAWCENRADRERLDALLHDQCPDLEDLEDGAWPAEQPACVDVEPQSSTPTDLLNVLSAISSIARAEAAKDERRAEAKRTKDYDRSLYALRAKTKREDAEAIDWAVGQMARVNRFANHYLSDLKHRTTGRDPKLNAYAYAEVPDWALRQLLDDGVGRAPRPHSLPADAT